MVCLLHVCRATSAEAHNCKEPLHGESEETKIVIGRIVMGRAAVLGVLAGLIALLMLASPASATLHGWCGSGATSTCIDNGTNTPTSNNPPNPFAFTGSMAETGVQYRIDVLVPNNEASA